MNRKLSLDDFLFDCIYLLGMIDSLALSLSTISDLHHAGLIRAAFRCCTFTLIIIKLIIDRKYPLPTFIWTVVSSLLLLVVSLRSRYNHMFYLLFILPSIRRVDLYQVIRFDRLMRIIITLLIIILALTGITENFVTYRTGSSSLRYALGFAHPNTLATIMLTLILEDAWLNKRPFSIIYLLFIWSIAALTYVVTINRTAVLLMVFFPFALIPASSKKPIGKYKRLAFLCVLPLLSIISVLLMNNSTSAITKAVDLFVSGRFTNAHRVYRSYGFSWFGQPVSLVSVKTARLLQQSIAMLDVAYLRCLVQAGIAAFALIFIIYTKLIDRLCRRMDRYTLILVLMFFAYGITESGFNNVYMNFTLLFAAKGVYSSDDLSLSLRQMYKAKAYT